MIEKQGIFSDPWLPAPMPLPVDALRSRLVTGPPPGFGPGRVAATAGLGASPDGLGKVFTTKITTPWGSESFSANVPYEDLAAGAVQELKSQAMAALLSILNPALQQAGAYVTDTLWPTMQPKLRAELDRVITIAEGKVKDVEKRVTTKAVVVAGCRSSEWSAAPFSSSDLPGGKMSYFAFSYRNPPPPYAGPTTDVPYPGWGIQPHAAGPARVGVGAITPGVLKFQAIKAPAPPSEEMGGVPWWVWLAVPMALGGGLLFAYDQGWLGRKKLAAAA